MAGAVFQMLGGEAVEEGLMGLGPATRKVVRAALRRATGPMLAAIKRRIHDRTGTLRRGLRLRTGKRDRTGRYSMLLSSWTTREKFAATRSGKTAGTVRAAGRAKDRYRVYYGPMVEYGHANARGHGRTAAYPFMRPGFDEVQASTAALIESELISSIEAAWR